MVNQRHFIRKDLKYFRKTNMILQDSSTLSYPLTSTLTDSENGSSSEDKFFSSDQKALSFGIEDILKTRDKEFKSQSSLSKPQEVTGSLNQISFSGREFFTEEGKNIQLKSENVENLQKISFQIQTNQMMSFSPAKTKGW